MSKIVTNIAFDPVNLPVTTVQAIQTTRVSLSTNLGSNAPFDAFNLGLHVGDDAIQVEQNRRQLLDFLPEQANIQWLDQVHGADVAQLKAHSAIPVVADAAITQIPKLALAVMTADCLPILLTNQTGSEVAAIHGGWRPLAANIIKKTIAKMTSEPADIIAWLGPCIGKSAFEVGDDVKQAFIEISADFESCFLANGRQKWLADLVQIATIMLRQQKVKQVINGHGCTFNNNNRYYSYRKHSQTGRMASLICIK